MISIVGIHGVGHLDREHPASNVVAGMSALWASSLAQGLGNSPDALKVTCAYYAPFLAPAAIHQGDGLLNSLPKDAQDMFLDWIGELGAPPAISQGRLGTPLRQAADWVQEHFPWFTDAMITIFFREVAAYLHTPEGGQRVAAREEVAQTIRDQRPQVVIGHSLGTVVAYEALWAHPELPVEVFITLGSPLGMSHVVFPRLVPPPENGRGDRPPGVRRWINVADHGDPVAVPPGLRSRFSGVELDLKDSIALVSIHSSLAYLRSPPVAATLAPYVTGE